MKYYVGETFEEAKRTAKEYKSLLYAKNKADNTGMMVFDENGTKVHPLKVELTDDVPDGALDENEDGTLKVYFFGCVCRYDRCFDVLICDCVADLFRFFLIIVTYLHEI